MKLYYKDLTLALGGPFGLANYERGHGFSTQPVGASGLGSKDRRFESYYPTIKMLEIFN